MATKFSEYFDLVYGIGPILFLLTVLVHINTHLHMYMFVSNKILIHLILFFRVEAEHYFGYSNCLTVLYEYMRTKLNQREKQQNKNKKIEEKKIIEEAAPFFLIVWLQISMIYLLDYCFHLAKYCN